MEAAKQLTMLKDVSVACITDALPLYVPTFVDTCSPCAEQGRSYVLLSLGIVSFSLFLTVSSFVSVMKCV